MLIAKSQHKNIKLNVSSQNGHLSYLHSANSNEGKLLFGSHRNITVADPSLSAKLNNLGYGLLVNTDYTEASPLQFEAGVKKIFPLNYDLQNSNVTSELPTGFENWYDGTKFNGERLGNYFLFQVFFDYIQESTATKADVILNLGAFSYVIANFELSNTIAVKDSISFDMKIYISQTLLDNSADVELIFDDDVSVFNIRHTPYLSYYGRGD